MIIYRTVEEVWREETCAEAKLGEIVDGSFRQYNGASISPAELREIAAHIDEAAVCPQCSGELDNGHCNCEKRGQ